METSLPATPSVPNAFEQLKAHVATLAACCADVENATNLANDPALLAQWPSIEASSGLSDRHVHLNSMQVFRHEFHNLVMQLQGFIRTSETPTLDAGRRDRAWHLREPLQQACEHRTSILHAIAETFPRAPVGDQVRAQLLSDFAEIRTLCATIADDLRALQPPSHIQGSTR